MSTKKTTEKPTKKTTSQKKAQEPGYEKKYHTYSSRISYPATYQKPLMELAKEKDKKISQLYTIAIREFLLKHNRLQENNQAKKENTTIS